MSLAASDAASGGGGSVDTAHPRSNLVRRSKVHWSHLCNIAGKPKHGPLAAAAELADNAKDAGATRLRIYTLPGPEDKPRAARILFANDGLGMSEDRVHECLSLGYTEGASAQRIGMYGGGFQSGTMGLGESALLMTRTESTITVGMLSLTFLREMGEKELKLPMLTWHLSPHAALGACPWKMKTDGPVHDQNLDLLTLYTAYGSHEALLGAVLEHVPATGTCVECYDLHANQLLFDPAAPDGDIRLAAGCKTHTNLPVEEAPALDHSFRAYLALLYLDSRMAVELCGQPVVPRLLTSELAHKQHFSVDPDKKTALRVRMTFGLDVLGKSTAGRGGGAPKVSKARGVFLYWHGRLIRAYERVRLGSDLQKLDDVAGVLGVMELNHLEVHQDKQEFKEELGASKRAYTNMLQHVSKNMTDYVLECMGGGGHGGEPLLQLEGYTTRIAEAATQQAEALRQAVMRRQEVDNDGRDVVFCDGCGKYRFVSDELCAEVEQAGDAFRWECSMNPDPLRNTCEAPEEEPRAPEDGRARAPEETLPNPPFLTVPGFAGWRTVQVKRARALGDKTHDTYYYAPGSDVRLRSRKEVARFLQQAEGSKPQEGTGRAKRKSTAQGGAGAAGGAGAGDAGTRDKRSRGKGVAAGAAAARLEKEAQDRVEKRLEEGRKEQAREKREMERQRLSFLREQAKFEKQKEEASRRSTRLAADAPAAQPRSIITRFCMCKKPESECDTHEMVQCIGCDDYFHPTCLVMTQHEITDERFILECVLHTPQAIAARERQAALLPPAATPSVSRDVSAAVALAGLTGRGEAEVASVRSKPLNWPRDVVYTARNVFTAPGSEEEKRRRLMERRTVIPGVEIFQLPVSHPVGLAGALGADGAQPACGVRATSPFAKDAVIGHYTGLVREKTERDLESKYVMVIPAGFPAFDLKERDEPYAIMVIDAKTCGNEMRFINDYRGNAHAPNVKFEERALRSADGTTEELIMAIVAERDIAVGEELTVFYGHTFEL